MSIPSKGLSKATQLTRKQRASLAHVEVSISCIRRFPPKSKPLRVFFSPPSAGTLRDTTERRAGLLTRAVPRGCTYSTAFLVDFAVSIDSLQSSAYVSKILDEGLRRASFHDSGDDFLRTKSADFLVPITDLSHDLVSMLA